METCHDLWWGQPQICYHLVGFASLGIYQHDHDYIYCWAPVSSSYLCWFHHSLCCWDLHEAYFALGRSIHNCVAFDSGAAHQPNTCMILAKRKTEDIYLSVCLFVCLPLCLSIYLSTYLSIYLSNYDLCVCLTCLCLCLCLCLPTYLPTYLPSQLSFFLFLSISSIVSKSYILSILCVLSISYLSKLFNLSNLSNIYIYISNLSNIANLYNLPNLSNISTRFNLSILPNLSYSILFYYVLSYPIQSYLSYPYPIYVYMIE